MSFAIQLATKNTYDGWITFEDGSKFKIDYPTLPQKAKLNSLLLKLSGVDKSDSKIVTQEYMRLYIKFTIKDWEIKDSPKCVLIKDDNSGSELSDNLWFMLCDSIPQTVILFNKISTELEADEETKKK